MNLSWFGRLWVVFSAGAVVIASPVIGRADDMGDKFGRGFANMTMGVVELPANVCDQVKQRGWSGYPIGFFKGIAMIPVRTLAGVYETLTFYVPFPDGYKPVMQPPTPFHYFYHNWRSQAPTAEPPPPPTPAK
jgi:putative exosortase-associated protein (TIGR04073 family)